MSDVESLEWLAGALFAPDAGMEFVVERTEPAPGREVLATFIADPSPLAPRLLVPLRPRRATLAATRRGHDAMPWTRRLGAAVAGPALVSGGAVPLRNRRIWLVGDPDAYRDPSRSVAAFVAHSLGLEAFTMAITMGPERYNRKPVLLLTDARGDLRAVAKVAADELTGQLVENEGTWLARLADHGWAAAKPPELLLRATWAGRPTIALRPLDRPLVHWRPNRHDPPAPIASAIADIGRADSVPAGELGHVVRCLVEADQGAPVLRAGVELVLDRWPGAALTSGAWHGDFTPWNMITLGRTLHLIDWEFAAWGVPRGFDMLHFPMMVATHLDGVDAPTALRHLERARRHLLGTVGVAGPDVDVTFAMYLLELARRDAEIERRGGEATGFGSAAYAALETHVG